ncbi:hypothetical protein SAVCW2_26490 [Streptomyces avermitilis]|uniref:Uncharacterized protein n=1 Tax=Streptomyces avermitilis TaxID=33903 RepID=A0A499VZL2_STRAX|nr:hypothetical protein SAVMC3_60050 [Streptomyces avermitilis]GDY83450.1 hypothetical protein SAVCW2_26490 [Streptomyces avermitilis]
MRRQVLGQPLPLPVAAREDQQQLHLGLRQRGAHALEHVGEVRLREEAGLRFGDDQGDRVRAVGGEGTGRRVRDIAELRDGRLDGRAGGVADPGDPLITRETVPRPTPARAATSSRVGRPPLRPRAPWPAIGSASRRPTLAWNLTVPSGPATGPGAALPEPRTGRKGLIGTRRRA